MKKLKIRLKPTSIRQFLPVRFADGITKEWNTYELGNKDIATYINNRNDLDIEYLDDEKTEEKNNSDVMKEDKEEIFTDNNLDDINIYSDTVSQDTIIDNEIVIKKHKNKKKVIINGKINRSNIKRQL